MMENSGVNRSAEGEEEAHDEKYSRLKISKVSSTYLDKEKSMPYLS